MRILKKIPICFLAIIIILGTTVSSIPNHTRATETDPLLVITSPELSAVIDDSQLTVTGFIDNIDAPVKDLVFTAYDSINTNLSVDEISNSKDNPDDWDITQSGDWTFNTNAMEGTHIISVMVQSLDPDIYAIDSTLFEKKATPEGPFVENVQIIVKVPVPKSEPVVFEPKPFFADDLTSVPVDSAIQIILTDTNNWDIYLSKLVRDVDGYVIEPSVYKPIWLFQSTNDTVQEPLPGRYKATAEGTKLTILFEPKYPLKNQSTYSVIVNPTLGNYDSNGVINTVYSRSLHFTTTTLKSNEKDPNNLQFFGDPHGSYTSNTNACSICHSTHEGATPTLLKGTKELVKSGAAENPDEPEQKDKWIYVKGKTEAYCLKCHGSTINPENPDVTVEPIAPPPINSDKTVSNHITALTKDKNSHTDIEVTESCSSCHDPHLTWTEDNPNLLQNQYSKQHETKDFPKGAPENEIIGKYSDCLTCHDGGNAPFLTSEQQQIAYQQFNYKKLSEDPTIEKIDDNLGNTNDYSLCLNCHKSGGPEGAANINQYYDNKNSGHKVEKRANGSSIPDTVDTNNGHIPCADCHDTHGSNNPMLLRVKVGNVKLSDDKYFHFVKDENDENVKWNSKNERNFCLQCHNDTNKMYGKTLALTPLEIIDDDPETLDEPIPISGHGSSDIEACSSCHGDNDTTKIKDYEAMSAEEQVKALANQQAISAAHAPDREPTLPTSAHTPLVPEAGDDDGSTPDGGTTTPPTANPTAPEDEEVTPAAPEVETPPAAPTEEPVETTEPIVTAESKATSSTQTGNIIKKTENLSAVRNDDESAPDVEVTE